MLLSVLLLGAAHRASVVGLSVLLAAAATFRLAKAPHALDDLSLALVGCGLWTLVALPAVPLSWLDVVSPHAADLWREALNPLGEPAPRVAPLALDAGAAWLEALKWFSYALVAAWSFELARERGLRPILLAVFAVAVVLAVVTLGHAVVEAQSVFGIYRPRSLPPWGSVSLLINPNNRSGYLNLGGFCGLGLLLSRRSPAPKSLVALGVVLCFSSSVWSGSRGGVAVLVVMLAVFGLVSAPRFMGKGGGDWLRRLPLVTSVALGLPTLAVLGFNPSLTRELFSRDLSKLEDLPSLVPAIENFWLFGVGRGGFQSIALAYMPTGPRSVLHYVENFLGSWAVEWGVPFAILLVVGLVLVLRPAYLRLRPAPPAQAAYLGVLTVLIQNLADIGLELFSLTSATIAVLAGLVGSRRERGGELGAIKRLAARNWASRVAVVGVGGAVLGTVWTAPDAYAARDQLGEYWDSVDRGVDDGAHMPARLKAEILRRPADPYPYLIGSLYAQQSRRPILPWASAALDRAPENGRVHFMVALGLRQYGAKKQALFHLVEALRYDWGLYGLVLPTASRLSGDPQFFIKSVSQDETGAKLLIGVANSWSPSESAQPRRVLAEAAIEADPTSVRGLDFLANEYLVQARQLEARCRRAHDVTKCDSVTDEAVALMKRSNDLAERLKRLDTCQGTLLQARILDASKRETEALDRLGDCGPCSNRGSCAQLGLSIAEQMGNAEARRRFEQMYFNAACIDYDSCARAERWLGSTAERRGDWIAAFGHYHRAAARGTDGELWLAAARTAARAGMAVEAERAYGEAKSLGSQDDQVKQLVDEARRDSVHRLLAPPTP